MVLSEKGPPNSSGHHFPILKYPPFSDTLKYHTNVYVFCYLRIIYHITLLIIFPFLDLFPQYIYIYNILIIYIYISVGLMVGLRTQPTGSRNRNDWWMVGAWWVDGWWFSCYNLLQDTVSGWPEVCFWIKALRSDSCVTDFVWRCR